MLDPLTGALLTLKQIRAMVDELFVAEAAWLPDFAQRPSSSGGAPADRGSQNVNRPDGTGAVVAELC